MRHGRLGYGQQRLLAKVLAEALATRQGRLTLVVVLVLAVAGFFLWQWWEQQHRNAPPPMTNAGHVRLATWNLKQFTERDRAGQSPPDLVTIAKIIREGQFDLVAIQEVQPRTQMVEKLRRQLNEPWRHAVSEVTGNHERYGFLWRGDRIELVEGPKLIEAADASVFRRVPAMATFRAGNFDFTVISVHLYYGDKANNPQRQGEAAAVARFARDWQARETEKDLIILGDFNEMRANGNMHLFEAAGFERLNREATNLSSTEVYDNLLINPRFTREYAQRVGVVRFDEMHFANRDKEAAESVSDHRPVWGDFDTTGPDDD